MADVLCVVAHPDDESLFAGGTLASLARNGKSVLVVAMSDGVTSRPRATGAEVRMRRDQFFKACAVLGVGGRSLSIFPDQRSDTVPQLTINRAVEEIVEAHKPQIVFTHHVGDLNIDHRRVAEAVLVATRRLKARIFSMAPEFRSRCVGPGWHPSPSPFGVVDWNAKSDACYCYSEEMRTRAGAEHQTEEFMELS